MRPPGSPQDGWVVLDPGHGGERDLGRSSAHGVRSPFGLQEKDLVLDLARRVAKRLRAPVRLTRTRDVNVSIQDRRALVKRLDAAVLVSLHANHGPPSARGAEVFVHRADAASSAHSAALATGLHRALDRAPHRCQVRGPLAADLALLAPEGLGSRTAACLVEVDYLSHRDSAQRLASEMGRESIAAAIAEAVNGYLRAAGGEEREERAGAQARRPPPSARAAASEQDEAARSDFLRSVAARPSKALAEWPKLGEGERMTLVTYMASRYGLAFANLFHATAKKTPIRKPTVSVTNTATPQSIAAQGFHEYGVVGGSRVYVRGDGDEVWLMSKGTGEPAKGGSANGATKEQPASKPASSQPAKEDAEKEQVTIEVEEVNGGHVTYDEDGNPIVVIPEDASSSDPAKPAPDDDDDDDDADDDGGW